MIAIGRTLHGSRSKGHPPFLALRPLGSAGPGLDSASRERSEADSEDEKRSCQCLCPGVAVTRVGKRLAASLAGSNKDCREAGRKTPTFGANG